MRVGAYTITNEIARGGMGVVYRGVDDTGRDVAIKVLLNGAQASSTKRQRFQREAESLARLNHPNVVRVHSTGEHQGAPYLVMDFVPGVSLRGRLEAEGPLPVREAAEITYKLAGALSHCHEQAVIHRDLKPENVLWSRGEPHLTDFGLAKDLDARANLTKTGLFMGTPGFLAPEQARGEEVGPAADVFGLGATLYALLTARPPYEGNSLLEILAAMTDRDPEPPSTWRPEVGRDLQAVCLRSLRRDPAERYASAQALADDLERFLQGEAVAASGRSGERVRRWAKRRRGELVASLVGGALVGGALIVAASTGVQPRERQSPSASGDASEKEPALGSAKIAEHVAQARAHLEARDFRMGLEALAPLSNPPAGLVWELNKRQTLRSLQNRDVDEALACLSQPASRLALPTAPAAMQKERAALAREVLEDARGLVKTLVAQDPEDLEGTGARLRLARALLPADEVIDAAALQTFVGLFQFVGIVAQRERNQLYVDAAIATVDLCPDDPGILRELGTLASRVGNLSGPDARRLVPYARRLVPIEQVRGRLVVSLLLFRAGELDEAMALSAEVLNHEDADQTALLSLLDERAQVFRGREQWPQAIESVKRALELMPNDLDLRLLHIDVLGEMGKRAEACEEARLLFVNVNWGTGGQVLERRPFRDLVSRMWKLGGRKRCPREMLQAVRRLLDGLQPSDPEVWWLKAAILEFDVGNRARGNVALGLALAGIADGPFAVALTQQVAAVRQLGDAPGRSAGDVIDDLLREHERLARRALNRARRNPR